MKIVRAAALALVLSSALPVAATSPLRQVAAADDTTCAIYLGAAFCWGGNANGQVGNNTTANAPTPAAVIGLGTGVTAIATSGSHSCAVKNGGAWCWGNNDYGQLGNDSQVDSLVPVPVTGLSTGVTAIAAGDLHTCAIVNASVKCWGSNGFGQLGDGSTIFSSAIPRDVLDGGGATELTAGRNHACAIFSGVASCWGRGDAGAMGNGTGTSINASRVAVAGFGGAAHIEGGGEFTCGVKDGGAFCWGFGGNGQLGNGFASNSTTPQAVSGLGAGVTGITAGSSYHACALVSGGASCWGYNNAGQLGNPGAGGGTLVPIAVSGLAGGVQQIAAGGLHTCAIAAAGLYCWGDNALGQLGTGGAASNVPVLVVPATVSSTLLVTPATLAFGGQSMNTTSPAQTVTIQNTGGAAITFTSSGLSDAFDGTTTCATLAPGASCTTTLQFTPNAVGTITGFAMFDSSAGLVVIDLDGIGEKSLVTHYYRSILRRAPDGGGKAFWESESARMQSIGVNVNETWYSMAGAFYGSAEYLGQGRDNAGFVTDLYTTFFNRAPDGGGLGFWVGNLDQGMPREVVLAGFMFSPEFTGFTQNIFGNTQVRKEIDTVVDYYRGILGRLPDSDGLAFWMAQFRAAQCAGATAVAAQAEAISSQFALSGEYAARARSNGQYVGDLYNAFLRRGGDLGGVQFWINALATGALTREQVRQQFAASPEFQARVQAVIAQGCLP